MRMMNGSVGDEIRDSYPCDDILDLTVGYRWLNVQEDGVRTSEPLKNEELEELGICRDSLFELARKNTKDLFSTRLYRLEDLVRRICEGSEACDLMGKEEPLNTNEIYVCTNDSGMFGAAVMLLEDVMKEIADRLTGKLYILPSSIHEVILVPGIEAYDLNMLKDTVRSVNSTVVSKCDFLSDNVYSFDSHTGKVEIVL